MKDQQSNGTASSTGTSSQPASGGLIKCTVRPFVDLSRIAAEATEGGAAQFFKALEDFKNLIKELKKDRPDVDW